MLANNESNRRRGACDVLEVGQTWTYAVYGHSTMIEILSVDFECCRVIAMWNNNNTVLSISKSRLEAKCSQICLSLCSEMCWREVVENSNYKVGLVRWKYVYLQYSRGNLPAGKILWNKKIDLRSYLSIPKDEKGRGVNKTRTAFNKGTRRGRYEKTFEHLAPTHLVGPLPTHFPGLLRDVFSWCIGTVLIHRLPLNHHCKH